ncbi:MAG: MopE-related protein [Saprospiraceae bacterium]
MQKILLFLLLACCPGLARAQAPGWSVNPSLFQHSMNLTAALRLDGSPENGTSNVLGAFVGNELRGVATPVPVNGTALYFLTVYSNKTSGETLQFKVYTNADDQTHPAGEMLAFVRGSVAGTATTPYLVNIRSDDDFPISLSNIPGQTRNTGEPFAPIALADYLQSPDGGPVSWSATAGPNLSANVVGSTLTVTATDPNWAGTSTVLVTATETGTTAAYSASKTVNFTVNAALPAPVFSAIPVQHICQITTFPDGDLDNYLTFSGGCLTYSMRPLPPSGTAPDPGWTQPNSPPGSMTLAVRAQFGGADVDGAGLQLAVFVGGQLAGVATPTELAGVRTYFLTAANIGAGDVSFQLYDGGRQYLHGKRDGGFAFVPNGNLKDVTVEFSPLSISVNATTGAWSATVVDPDWFGTLTVEAVAANCADATRSDAEQTTFTRYQSGSCPLLPFYQDADDDGYGNPSVSILALSLPTGYAANNTDCDDTNTDINPAATELAGDEIDQNCDGAETCFVDSDGDGYRPGTGTATVNSTDSDCSDTGEALATDPTGDCDDTDTAFNPAATEAVGDEIDQDCNDAEICYLDADDDGYRPGTGTATANSTDTDCDDTGEALATDPTGDCNDTNDAIRPNATELAGDNVDQNCDGAEICFTDADNDGYRPGTGTATVNSADTDCDDSNEALASDPTGDCNDGNAAVNPAAAENCGIAGAPGVDDDCDGSTDEDLTNPTAICRNVTLAIGASGNAALAAAQINNGSSDNCTAAGTLTLSASPNLFDCADAGTTVAVLTVTDEAGRTATCVATVTVLDVLNYTETVRRSASDGLANDKFGWGVAVEGTLAVAGAPEKKVGTQNKQGAAYLFNGSNNWSQFKKLLAADGATIDYFGNSASFDGPMLALGAYGDNVGTVTDQGSAYIFSKDQGGTNNWGQVVRVSSSDGAAYDYFANAVSLKSGRLLAGANKAKVNNQGARGAAYLFEQNAGGTNNWGQVKKLTASDGAANNFFGAAVVLAADRALVSANGNLSNRGAAYIFEKDAGGAGNWGQVKKLTASDAAVGDGLGTSAAMSGDRILLGAPNKAVYAGAAYIFEKNAGGAGNWGQVKKLVAADAATNDRFGASVALSGDYAYVAALRGNTDKGAVYVFYRDAGGSGNWGQIGKYAASDGLAGDQYGYALAASGTVLMVGANTDDVGTRADQGSAYFLKGEDCPDASKPEDETTAAPDFSGQSALFSCSPNPFRDELTVQLPGGGGATHVKILDATGGAVLSIELPAGQPQAILKTGWLPVGFYFVQVKTADGTATAPVVKL